MKSQVKTCLQFIDLLVGCVPVLSIVVIQVLLLCVEKKQEPSNDGTPSAEARLLASSEPLSLELIVVAQADSAVEFCALPAQNQAREGTTGCVQKCSNPGEPNPRSPSYEPTSLPLPQDPLGQTAIAFV
ncbi:unnamed protein product [Heligmosomoides polygyrus]|uniref:Uncharacterized protein n=1 Tax=Heligmosomoides polygyrus TaxID=6339 RepID=A0A183GS49_HELPZ|nr:unnamed protein product [Heligmosomoides polygyrus]